MNVLILAIGLYFCFISFRFKELETGREVFDFQLPFPRFPRSSNSGQALWEWGSPRKLMASHGHRERGKREGCRKEVLSHLVLLSQHPSPPTLLFIWGWGRPVERKPGAARLHSWPGRSAPASVSTCWSAGRRPPRASAAAARTRLPPTAGGPGKVGKGRGHAGASGRPAFSLQPGPRRRAEPRGAGGGHGERPEPRGDPELPTAPGLRGAGGAPRQGELRSRKPPARCRERAQAARRAGKREPAPGRPRRQPPAGPCLAAPGTRRGGLAWLLPSPSAVGAGWGGGGGAGRAASIGSFVIDLKLLAANLASSWLRGTLETSPLSCPPN